MAWSNLFEKGNHDELGIFKKDINDPEKFDRISGFIERQEISGILKF